MTTTATIEYGAILEDLKRRIKQSQYKALYAVNKELVSLYWDLGKEIYTQQQVAGWGTSVVEQLAQDLQIAFPGVKGFSSRNLWNMRDFYSSYHQSEKLQALSAEISWSHNVGIIEKCKDPLEREFYIKMSKKHSWSYRVLLNQISNKTFEKTLLSQTNFERNLPSEIRTEAKLAIKDEYIFDFLELGEDHSEYELEGAILSKIEKFLREMGGVFAFVGSQYRLEIEGEEFFIDILLYHRRLKSLVAVELKVGKFIPEYVGKMQFYLAVLDDRVRMKDENPSIGIILCKDKKRTIVEYALKDTQRPIGVAAYQVVRELPQELQKELPSVEQIARLLDPDL